MKLDDYQEEIEELYMNQKKKQSEVVTYLHEKHGYDVKPGALKVKLKAWGYTRNVTRPQALALVRAAERTGLHWQDSLDCRENPARAANLERYLRRNKISSSLAPAQQWRVPEQIFHNNIALITASFESSRWVSDGDQLIILSSPRQAADMRALHHFLVQLELANDAASSGRLQIAGGHWRGAFALVDTLVTGQYHDTLPNILQKINDLKVEGHTTVARELQTYLARRSSTQNAYGLNPAIFQALRLIHLDDMADIEERVMRSYVELFDKFLGHMHYNSFVMRMNHARRQLRRHAHARLEDYLPSLELYDGLFGPCDRRSLDIIRLRVETSHHRGDLWRTELEAHSLIDRASLVVGDEWQRLYFLIKGFYYLALAQHSQGNHEASAANMVCAISHITEFSEVDRNDMFVAEKAKMEECLQEQNESSSGGQPTPPSETGSSGHSELHVSDEIEEAV